MPVTVERVTDTDPATVDTYATVIARAFRPIPFTILPAGIEGDGDDDPGWTRLLTRLRSEVFAGVRDLEVWGARVGDTPGAAMIVAPPGVAWGSTPHAENEYSRALRTLETDEIRATRARMMGFKKEVGEAFGPEGEVPTYSVCWLGTAPAAQRQGLAAALLRHVLDRAHAEGNAVTLVTQTPENAAWYQRFGLRVLAHVEFKERGVRGGYWSMTSAPGG